MLECGWNAQTRPTAAVYLKEFVMFFMITDFRAILWGLI